MEIYWRRLITYRLLLVLIIFIIGGSALRQATSSQPTETTTTTTTTIVEWTEENLNLLIEQTSEEEKFDNVYLLKQLAFHESHFLKYPEVIEHNGWYSRGLFHFRTSTFIQEGIKYGVISKDTTTEEALILTYNPELQIRIVCRMGNDNMNYIRQHWVNSWAKIFCY
jgi:hypothetical protein